MQIKEIIKNTKLVHKYPMIKEDLLNRWTLLDLIPIGWNSLLLTMLDEIKRVCGEDVFDRYSFADIKEKYGELRITHDWLNEEDFTNLFTNTEELAIAEIETKYENISKEICGECGRSLRDGEWYICEECIHSFEKVVKKDD